MNYYPFHIGDYAVHTRHLTLMEDLAYRRLLDWYYIHERAIPAETQSVARLLGMREHAAEIEAVLREFFATNAAGEWTHTRCDTEIAKARAHAERARNNGKGGGRPSGKPGLAGAEPTPPKAPKPPKTDSVIPGNPLASDLKAPIPKPIPKDKTKAAPGGTGFAKFWSVWPVHHRKAARLQCWTKWKDKGFEPRTAEIVAHVESMKASEQWRKDGGKYIPATLVYLNQDRFEAPTEAQATAEAQEVNWRESWRTVVKKGKALGCGDWSEDLWAAGKAPAYPSYLARVEAAFKKSEQAEEEPA